MMPQATDLSVFDALAWQAEMGADACVEAMPQKSAGQKTQPANLASHSPLAGESKSSLKDFGGGALDSTMPHRTPPHQNVQERFGSPTRGEQGGSPSLANIIAEARALADAAGDLAALEAALRGFNGCALKKTATNTVFAQGAPESRLMFIGEAPGADEDRAGVPFCGASGQLLDKMLGFIGLDRSKDFYITNTLFWRPPGNRQPTPEELEICKPFVEKHIALVNPKLLVLVGGTATKAVLGEERGITRLRGQRFTYTNRYLTQEIPVAVIYHPSYLLRQPLAKKQAWGDLLAIKANLTH